MMLRRRRVHHCRYFVGGNCWQRMHHVVVVYETKMISSRCESSRGILSRLAGWYNSLFTDGASCVMESNNALLTMCRRPAPYLPLPLFVVCVWCGAKKYLVDLRQERRSDYLLT